MQIGKQHGDFETGSLHVHQFVDRDKVTEVDLAAGFIPGLHPFFGL